MSTQPKSAADPLVITPTKCRLCGKLFPPESLHQASILAATPEAKARQVQTIMAPLMKHLEQHHAHVAGSLATIDQNRNYTQFVELQVANYRGLLLLEAFETSEPVFLEQREIARVAIHRKTQKVTINDGRLRTRLTEVFYDDKGRIRNDSGFFLDLLGVLKELRDKLEERTPHSVSAIKPS